MYSEQIAEFAAAACPAFFAATCKRRAYKQLGETETWHDELARTLRVMVFRGSRSAGQAGIEL
jgi:hypothetical protein